MTTTVKKPAKKKTFLNALNKVRKDKGKSTLKGGPLKKAGPVTLARVARSADKSAAKKKKK